MYPKNMQFSLTYNLPSINYIYTHKYQIDHNQVFDSASYLDYNY